LQSRRYGGELNHDELMIDTNISEQEEEQETQIFASEHVYGVKRTAYIKKPPAPDDPT
jgi:hypothetical protein